MKGGNEQQGGEQREGERRRVGGVSSPRGVGMGNLNFRGDLWKQLHGAKETNSVSDCCRTVLLNCLSVIYDGFAPKISGNPTI